MPMRATTVRFSEALWTLVEREAQADGVSAAQYVRDATILRTAYSMGQRGDPVPYNGGAGVEGQGPPKGQGARRG